MRYLSVCSGIEAASVAWSEWEPAAFSEIEPFPSAVLAHRFPNVPNLGDMTKYKGWDIGTIDLLVGGTPCQSFSVAGLRKGLDDPRGNLALVYCGLLDHFRPRWFIWENVPGVLSSNGGRDFGAFLGAVGQLGYGFAYRVLDAQWFGVAQRRRRVFVVGHLGDWRRAAAVLFERESLRRDIAPRREAREGAARGAADRAAGGGGAGLDCVGRTFCMSSGQANAEIALEHAPTLSCLHEAPISFHPTQTPINNRNVCHSLNANANATAAVSAGMRVRRLTPTECERLQGFPDGWTLVPYRGKPAKDGPRYKALGNSMAVPVMRWIGQRIAKLKEQV